MRLAIMVSLVFVGAAVNAQLTASSTFEKLMTNGQYAEALQETNEQLARMPPSQLVFWQNQKAQLQIILGAYNDAEATLNQIKPVDAFDEATTLSTKGFLQLNKGRFDLAVEALQHSWDKFQSAQRQSTREAAACLSSLSQVYRTLGKQNQALEFENRALQTRLQLFGENSEEVAASYSNLGVIYTLSDLDKALEMHEKAQDVYQKIHGENHPKLAITAVNIGIAHQRLKFYDDAISHFETAKKIWDQIYPNGHPNQAIVLRNLATTYGLLNDEQAALTYYQQALDVYKKAYGHKHPDLASTYNDMGRFHLNNRRYEEALQAYQQALLANAIVYSTTDAKANPSVKENFYNETVGLFSLHLKSLALEERHYGKTLKLEDLKDALSALYSCDSLIDNIRQHSTDEEDKLALGALANEVYEDGVRIAYTISEMVLTSPKYLQGAFYFAEKSKSAVLQESIADAQAKLYAGIPPDLLEQEKQLKSNIALLNQKLAQKPDDAEVKKLREDLFTVNGQYQQFVKNLEKNFPNYFNLKFSKSETTVADLQAALAPQAALVSYFLAERGKRVYQFILSQNKFKVTSRALPADYERYLKGLRNSLFHTSPTTFKKATRALAQALVPRVPSGITEVVIIPSGALSTVPFEALPLARVRGSEFDGVRYLISKLAVSYDFSASLFLQKKKMTKTRMAPSVFLCAPVVFDERQGLATLPGTQKEVASIANLFPQNARTVLYEEANESLVKSKELLHYSHLHFATHGVVDEESPASSRIFLSGSPNDDGNLYAGEIYNLNLNAELAVLSACETGLGKISKGEGVIGLSRALIYAGAKNIVVSFWTVADESTAELMTNFYKEVAAHPSQHFSRSLQVAKLKLIEEKTFSDPYHWAPFVLVGE